VQLAAKGTRLDAGLVKATIGPVSVAQVLMRVEAEFGGSTRAKGLSLVVERSDAWVQSDAVLLHGVLSNLVSNAIKYTRAGQVEVRVKEDGDAVHGFSFLHRFKVMDGRPSA
jgi:signal transduction histidine kinase